MFSSPESPLVLTDCLRMRDASLSIQASLIDFEIPFDNRQSLRMLESGRPG